MTDIKRNKILALRKDDGEWIHVENEIKGSALWFYKNLFAEEKQSRQNRELLYAASFFLHAPDIHFLYFSFFKNTLQSFITPSVIKFGPTIDSTKSLS